MIINRIPTNTALFFSVCGNLTLQTISYYERELRSEFNAHKQIGREFICYKSVCKC